MKQKFMSREELNFPSWENKRRLETSPVDDQSGSERGALAYGCTMNMNILLLFITDVKLKNKK